MFFAASPDDLLRFLIWQDNVGRTKLHSDPCPLFGSNAKRTPCACPTRLAAGTVDNLIAKLKSLYSSLGSDSQPYPSSFNNPAAHPSLTRYLKSIREEQAKARITPQQAVPMFFDKFLALCSYLTTSLSRRTMFPLPFASCTLEI